MENLSTAAPGIIIYGPPGCGKTTHAVCLAKHYGKTRIVDDWTPGARLSDDTLALTSQPHQGAIAFLTAATEAKIRIAPGRVTRIKAAVSHQSRSAA